MISKDQATIFQPGPSLSFIASQHLPSSYLTLYYKSAFILIKSNTNGQSFTLSDEMQESKKKNTEEERMDCILAEELYYVPEEKY